MADDSASQATSSLREQFESHGTSILVNEADSKHLTRDQRSASFQPQHHRHVRPAGLEPLDVRSPPVSARARAPLSPVLMHMAERKAGGAEELRRTLTGNMIKAMSMHSHNHMRSAMEQLGASIRLAETSKRLRMEHSDRIKSRRQQALPWLPKYKSLPTRIFLVLDDPPSCKLAQVWAVLIMAVIVATAVALCVESLPKFRIQIDKTGVPPPFFFWFEVCVIILFTIEYVLRLVTASCSPERRRNSVADAPMAARARVSDAGGVAAHFARRLSGDMDSRGARSPAARRSSSKDSPMPGRRRSSATPTNTGGKPDGAVPTSSASSATAKAGATATSAPSAIRGGAAAKPSFAPASAAASGSSPKRQRLSCRRRLAKTWLWVIQPLNIIDLISILPFYMELAFTTLLPGVQIIRILRLARALRVFRLSRYSSGAKLFATVILASRHALLLMMACLSILSLLFGSIIFFVESGTYDERTGKYMRPDVIGDTMEESPFYSIPQCFYWVIVTATTVGYGDMYPTSAAGKFVTSIVMQLGILVLALPITVVGANFAIAYSVHQDTSDMPEDEELFDDGADGTAFHDEQPFDVSAGGQPSAGPDASAAPGAGSGATSITGPGSTAVRPSARPRPPVANVYGIATRRGGPSVRGGVSGSPPMSKKAHNGRATGGAGAGAAAGAGAGVKASGAGQNDHVNALAAWHEAGESQLSMHADAQSDYSDASEANVVTSANDALLGMGQPRSSTSAAEPASRQSPSQADNRAKVTRQDVQALVAEARVLNNRLVQVLQALQTAGVEH